MVSGRRKGCDHARVFACVGLDLTRAVRSAYGRCLSLKKYVRILGSLVDFDISARRCTATLTRREAAGAERHGHGETQAQCCWR